MNFMWFDLLQFGVVVLFVVLFIALLARQKFGLAIGALVLLIATIFMPPVNITKPGYGSIEQQNLEIEVKELPERVTVEQELPFEERVKEDIKQYEEERNNG